MRKVFEGYTSNPEPAFDSGKFFDVNVKLWKVGDYPERKLRITIEEIEDSAQVTVHKEEL